MTKQDKLKNIFAFLCILFGDDIYMSNQLMKMRPDYIIEKYNRYVESNRDEWPWGIHPSLRHGYFDIYFDKWKDELMEDDEKE